MQREFLEAVLPRTGVYCAVGIPPDGQTIQKHTSSLDKLEEYLAGFDESGNDTYVALHTFQKKRHAEQSVQAKSFYLDLDIFKDTDKEKDKRKKYPDKQTALREFQRFLKSTGLPKPTYIIDSGGGIHVYWVLAKAVDSADWKATAERLKTACANEGFKADASITADIARIMRVPGTHNHKFDPPRVCTVLRNSKQLYKHKQIKTALDKAVPDLSKWSDSDIEDVAIGGEAPAHVYKSFKKIVQRCKKGTGCAQIAYRLTKQAEIDYEEWLDILSIVKFCDDTEDKHLFAVSSKHPDFSERITLKRAAGLNTPRLCSTFEEHTPGKCDGCPHKGKIKTPIILGKKVPEATPKTVSPDSGIFNTPVADEPEYPKLPWPYFYGPDFAIYRRTKDKDNEDKEILVHPDVIFATDLTASAVGTETTVSVEAHFPLDPVKRLQIRAADLASPESMKRTLLGAGISILPACDKEVLFYLMSWIRELQKRQLTKTHVDQFGWFPDLEDKPLEGFVVGDTMYTKDGTRQVLLNKSLAENYRRTFSKRGDLQGWKTLMDYYNKSQFEDKQMMILLTFAAPLMHFVDGLNGAIYHIYSSTSGTGKTTAQMAGASAWGHPKSYTLGARNTSVGVEKTLSIYKNFCVYVDELSNETGERMSNFAYQTANGVENTRGTVSHGKVVTAAKNMPWNLMVGTSANTSMLNKIASYRAGPAGETARITEVAGMQIPKKDQDKRINALWEKNYGYAGPEFIKHLIANYSGNDGKFTKLEKVLEGMMNKIIKRAGLSEAQDRYWYGSVAACLVAGKIAQNAGLIPFDMQNLYNWICKVLQNNKKVVKGAKLDGEELAKKFFNDRYNQIIKIDSRAKNVPLPPMQRVVGRFETDMNNLWIIPEALREWCNENNRIYNDVKDAMEKDCIEFKGRAQKRIYAGTDSAGTSRQWCVMVKFRDDEEDEEDDTEDEA